MPLALRIAAYWVGVTAVTYAWYLGIDSTGMWPVPVQLTLVAMAPMAGLWWHLVLFQDTLKALREARKAGRAATPEAPKVVAAVAAAGASAESLVAAALAEARDAAAALAWDAAMQRELKVRRDFDADFAAAARSLRESERGVLLLASRDAVVRGNLKLAAGLLVRGRGMMPASEDPLRRRLAASLETVSPALAAEFAIILDVAPDLDPVEVSRRLVARHGAELEKREAAAAQSALELLNRTATLLTADTRAGVRAAVVAQLAGKGEAPVLATLEAYVATAHAPETVALAALGLRAPALARTAEKVPEPALSPLLASLAAA
jgi:hypothetical protein